MRTSKHCSDCDQYKPSSEFHRNKASNDGLCNVCAVCSSIRKKQRYQRPEVRARYILQAKEWRMSNPDRKRAHGLKWRRSEAGKRYRSQQQADAIQRTLPRYIRSQAKATGTSFEATKRRIIARRGRRAVLFLLASTLFRK